MPPSPIRVIVEATPKRAFASAVDWPGWCRAGRDEAGAIEALGAYAPRYAVVARTAGVPFTAGDTAVVERMPGNATTAFGAPAIVADIEREALGDRDAARLTRLLAAAWTVFDEVVAAAPPSLRKGPRGGGRDRDPMVDHVLDAEHAYARKLGVRRGPVRAADRDGVIAYRAAILEVIRAGAGVPHDAAAGPAWAPRYAARRIAWHVLDHAWEMEDRTEM